MIVTAPALACHMLFAVCLRQTGDASKEFLVAEKTDALSNPVAAKNGVSFELTRSHDE
jgi:hypothetical protein